MPKLVDSIMRRIIRQLTGKESSTQPGRTCARCGKDMSNYMILLDPEPTDVCNECDVEIHDEEYTRNWRETPPPEYDIDAILGGEERKPHQIVDGLWHVLDTPCAESKLFEPEVVIRDYCEYNQFSGHDLGYVLALNRGDYFLLGGLRAMRAIGAAGVVRWMEAFKEVAEHHGVVFPDPLPDPWLRHVDIERELVELLDEESRRLAKEIEPRKDMSFDGLDRLLVAYVKSNVELLRQRKPKGNS